MIIVSDTSPLRYLIEIGEVEILPSLFGRVVIPQRVFIELQGRKTPESIKAWIQKHPEWLEVRRADLSFFTPQKKIGEGEREAIALGLELGADALLVDDTDGRKEAERVGLSVIPTLAILELAAQQDLIDLPDAVDRLSKTSFRASLALFERVLDRDRQRKQAGSKTDHKTEKQE